MADEPNGSGLDIRIPSKMIPRLDKGTWLIIMVAMVFGWDRAADVLLWKQGSDAAEAVDTAKGEAEKAADATDEIKRDDERLSNRVSRMDTRLRSIELDVREVKLLLKSRLPDAEGGTGK